jgi:hypothetical protein
VTFLGLFKREVDLSELIPEAHALLGEVNCGESEQEARRAVGASEEELRRWKRHPAFREALRKAKTEPHQPKVWDLDNFPDPSSATIPS